jgi:hypothetical protein
MKILAWLSAHPLWNIFLMIVVLSAVVIGCYAYEASVLTCLLSLTSLFFVVAHIELRVASPEASDYAVEHTLQNLHFKNASKKVSIAIDILEGKPPYTAMFSNDGTLSRNAEPFEALISEILDFDDSDASHRYCMQLYLAINEKAADIALKVKKGSTTVVEEGAIGFLSEMNILALKNVKARKMLLEQKYGSVTLVEYVRTPLPEYQEHLDEYPNAHLCELFQKAKPTERQLAMTMVSEYEDEPLLNRMLDVEIEMSKKAPESA